nr:MAG TPA: hypothetical protein [Caudoviricetes sp.]
MYIIIPFIFPLEISACQDLPDRLFYNQNSVLWKKKKKQFCFSEAPQKEIL